MSIRVASNIANGLGRQISKNYNVAGNGAGTTNAMGVGDPNTWNSNTPLLADAMGRMGETGVLTFCHDSGATRTVTIWEWSEMIHQATNGVRGWVKAGGSSTLYTQSVDPWSKCSITLPENANFILTADAVIANVYLGGCRPHPTQRNLDLQGF